MTTDNDVKQVFASVTCQGMGISSDYCSSNSLTISAAKRRLTKGLGVEVKEVASSYILSSTVTIAFPLSSTSSPSTEYQTLSTSWSSVVGTTWMSDSVSQGLLSSSSVLAASSSTGSSSVLAVNAITPTSLTGYSTANVPTMSPAFSPTTSPAASGKNSWSDPVVLYGIDFGLNGLYCLLLASAVVLISTIAICVLSYYYCQCCESIRNRRRGRRDSEEYSVVDNNGGNSTVILATDCLPMDRLQAGDIPLAGIPMASVRLNGGISGEGEVVVVDLDAVVLQREADSMRKQMSITEDRVEEGAIPAPSAPPMMPEEEIPMVSGGDEEGESYRMPPLHPHSLPPHHVIGHTNSSNMREIESSFYMIPQTPSDDGSSSRAPSYRY